MGIEIKITSRIPEAKTNIESTARQRMHEAVNEVRNETLDTLSGSRSGRQYKVPGTSRYYTASAPGEPPAQRLGELRQSISTEVGGEAGQLIGKVGTDKDYGPMLEYGTRKMAARPWLSVAFEKAANRIIGIFSRKWLP